MSAGYLTRSTASGESIALQTALGRTPDGEVDHPELFRGFLGRPDVAAAAILAVADVAAARYADPALLRWIGSGLDPVVTASGDRLRFESFSACNGVHARFDLLPEGIESGAARFGTTNIDINQPLRTALSKVGRSGLLHLSVGDKELTVSTPDESFLERQVVLPDRWVRGFAETPLLARAATHRCDLVGPAVARFIASLPRTAPGADQHLVPVHGGLRQVLAPRPGSVLLAGAARLGGAARIVPFATRLRVYASPSGVSGWVFDLPAGRFTLLLTPGAYRGFSGEGSLLTLLARPDARRVGERLADELAWEPTIEVSRLARHLNLAPADVDAGLVWLAAAGRVGYDLAERTWFHRDLPVDAAAILTRNPRLARAQRIAESETMARHDGGWRVPGTYGQHHVADTGGRLRCDCIWEDKHADTRGPCTHILAVMVREGQVGIYRKV
jgi:hypothetical protein